MCVCVGFEGFFFFASKSLMWGLKVFRKSVAKGKTVLP